MQLISDLNCQNLNNFPSAQQWSSQDPRQSKSYSGFILRRHSPEPIELADNEALCRSWNE